MITSVLNSVAIFKPESYLDLPTIIGILSNLLASKNASSPQLSQEVGLLIPSVTILVFLDVLP